MTSDLLTSDLVHQRDTLVHLLSGDLDFHAESSRELTHDLHAFAAKFPPQIPRLFIQSLTVEGDYVLDPMAGSGTTIVETCVARRHAVGFDIDPLALRLNEAKTRSVSALAALQAGRDALQRAKRHVDDTHAVPVHVDTKTRAFIDYWFHPRAQQELTALIEAIRAVCASDIDLKNVLELVFSGIIITKSGGVSMALDLAHTRPHKKEDKPYRSPFVEFDKRLKKVVSSLSALPPDGCPVQLARADAQSLPLPDRSIDLIVTSPPYPATAIDYMRAHKFSLVWLGHPIESLSDLRGRYVGSEGTKDFQFEALPERTDTLMHRIANADRKKALSIRRYYSEMTRILREMYRVLKPGKCAVLVVGSSTVRDVDTEVHKCLEEIGTTLGFEVPHIGLRKLDRDRRMMPAFRNGNQGTQIEKRMHVEHVVGFWKPG